MVVPGGARNTCSQCSWASREQKPWLLLSGFRLSRYHTKPCRCTVPIWLVTQQRGPEPLVRGKTPRKTDRHEFFTLSFMWKRGKFFYWFSFSLRQWRAWSDMSERIKFLFFSNHFTFCKNCIFMRVRSLVGTRWQLSFPGNQEINQAAKLRCLHCEILLTFQKVVLNESYF